MGWGFWKKIKNGAKRFRDKVSGLFKKGKEYLNKGAEFVKKAKPIISSIDFDKFNPQLGGIMRKVDDYSDDLININDKLQNNDFRGAVNYAGKYNPKINEYGQKAIDAVENFYDKIDSDDSDDDSKTINYAGRQFTPKFKY